MLSGVCEAVSNISKSLAKSIRKSRKEKKSLEYLVSKNKIPHGGLRDLQFACKQGQSLLNIDILNLNKESFAFIKGWTVASMYSFCPQGRIGAINSMTNQQSDKLFETGMELAEDFKTSQKFGRQPILLPDEAKPAFNLLKKVRTIKLIK